MSTESIPQTDQERKQAIHQAKLKFLRAIQEGTPEEYEPHLPDFYHWLAANDPDLLSAIQACWPSTFYSVSASSSAVMFCPVPKGGRR